MRRVDTLLTLSATLLTLHLYDWTLHAEDLTPYSVPWQRPEVVGYTTFWTTYWGVASILSTALVVILVRQYRRGDHA